MSRRSLSNLTRPALIMVSTFMLIHMFAFFIEHSKTSDNHTYAMQVLSAGVQSKNMIPEFVVAKEKPAAIITHKKKVLPSIPETNKTERISPSGELVP